MCAGRDIGILAASAVGCSGNNRCAAFIQNDLVNLDTACIRIEDHCLYGCAYIRRNVIGCLALSVCADSHFKVGLFPAACPGAERTAGAGVLGGNGIVQSCSLCTIGNKFCIHLLVACGTGLCTGCDISILAAAGCSCCNSSCGYLAALCCFFSCDNGACSSSNNRLSRGSGYNRLLRGSGYNRLCALCAFYCCIDRTSLILIVQTSCCAYQSGIIVQCNFVALVILDGILIGKVGIARAAYQRAYQCMTLAAVANLSGHFVIACIAGSCSVVCILDRIAFHTDYKVCVLGVVAQNHAHLCLAPAGVICTALCILGSRQRSHLHRCVIAAAAPGVFTIISAFAVALLIQISGYLRPVRSISSDFTLKNCRTQADIVPAHGRIYTPLAARTAGFTLIAGIHKGVQECLIGVVLCCQVQPACCPCLIIIIVIGSIEITYSIFCGLVVLNGEFVQCLCIRQVFCIAEVDVVYSQCCGISCCNITCAIACLIYLTACIALIFRRAPFCVILVSVSNLINKVGDSTVAQCGAVLEILRKIICNGAQVACLSQRIIAVLEFIVAPAQS